MFGCVGTSVAGFSPPLNDVVVVVADVVVADVVVADVVVADVVVEDDSLVVEDDSLVVEDELDVVVVLVPSQPWLSVTTAFELSTSPSYVTKTLPVSPAVRLARSCQVEKKCHEPWPC